jgi:hypothetical protein
VAGNIRSPVVIRCCSNFRRRIHLGGNQRQLSSCFSEAFAGKARIDELIPERLRQRHEMLLREMSVGMKTNLFLEIPGIAPMALGPGSFFTNQTAPQADVYAAVAAALQLLRTETSSARPALGPRRFPVSTVLNHNDYLCAKWTDSILRAIFLRAATVDELTYADTEREKSRTRQLMHLILQDGDGEHDIALEVLVAASVGKCRLDNVEGLRVRLRDFGAEEIGNYLLDRLPQ